MPPPFAIAPARSPDEIAAIRVLFQAYAASLPIDLASQGFGPELAGLPGQYAPPGGTLLLARSASGDAIACAALRPLPATGECEMKRLYVTPAARGLGLGRALAEAILATARDVGYRTIRLDTLQSLTEAQMLYLSMGFTPTERYYDDPLPHTIFFQKAL